MLNDVEKIMNSRFRNQKRSCSAAETGQIFKIGSSLNPHSRVAKGMTRG
jgi:hypothetical protein